MEGIRKSVDGSFGDVVERVKAAFKDHGFGTLSEIDVRSTLKEKIGKEIEPYTILGVCNPGFAARAIEAEHEIGMFLPCTVLVHECAGRVNIAAQDPLFMSSISGNPGMGELAQEAHEKIAAAVAAI